MTSKALIVTTVHWPDDTRIRERLIRTLTTDFSVTYATKEPGVTDPAGIAWVPLRGNRFRRNMAALWVCLTARWDVLVLHDPELLLTGLVARLIRRSPVVFDVHENVPATAMTRSWVPQILRTPLAFLTGRLLRFSERFLVITLAEPGYSELFAREHPVFPNYPDTTGYPDPKSDGDGTVVYLGDVTRERGAEVAVVAARSAGFPLVFVGRASADVRRLAERSGSVRFEGLLPNTEALLRIRSASVALSPLLDTPNYHSSQPTKVLEYLSLGLPVVASDLPGTRELVRGLDAVILVEPNNPEALALGINQASQPGVRTAAISQAGSIRDRFSWPADDVRRFYSDLL